jgi:ribosomal protein L28
MDRLEGVLMNDYELKELLLQEIKELTENNYPKMWVSASALLTIEQLEIIKSVMKGE